MGFLNGLKTLWSDPEVRGKAIAYTLGATAVSVGRHLMPLLKKGEEETAARIVQMNDELKGIMARTGVKNLSQMDSSVIHKRNF